MEVRKFDHGDWSLSYAVMGTGSRNFVMLPGVSLHSVIQSAHAVETAYASFLTDYTIWLMERRDVVPEGETVEEMTADTVTVMESLGISDAYVFGASHGGMMAQVLAAEYPSLIKKAVYASTLASQNEVSKNIFGEFIRLCREHKIRELNRLFFDVLYSGDFLEANKQALERMLGLGTKEEAERLGILFESCAAFSYAENLSKITCPSLAIGAWNDRAVSGAASVEIAERIGCPFLMYGKYGHAVYDEAPDYKKRLKEFFDA